MAHVGGAGPLSRGHAAEHGEGGAREPGAQSAHDREIHRAEARAVGDRPGDPLLVLLLERRRGAGVNPRQAGSHGLVVLHEGSAEIRLVLRGQHDVEGGAALNGAQQLPQAPGAREREGRPPGLEGARDAADLAHGVAEGLGPPVGVDEVGVVLVHLRGVAWGLEW